jgi:hypothetical protein
MLHDKPSRSRAGNSAAKPAQADQTISRFFNVLSHVAKAQTQTRRINATPSKGKSK